MTNETAISVSLHTSSFRGDHAADIRKDYDLLPGETVPELMKRVKGDWPGGHPRPQRWSGPVSPCASG